MAKEEKLIELEIPKGNHKVVLERIFPLVEKYYKAQIFNWKFSDGTHIPEKFNFNELLVSCYTQGLKDGVQLPKQKLNRNGRN